MIAVREPVVAGLFYPSDADELGRSVQMFLKKTLPTAQIPKAMIVPHAGHVCSGPIAASAYAHLTPVRDTITRVVLLGPSHYASFTGIAACSADRFATPLGTVAVDKEAVAELLNLSQVHTFDPAHEREHCLEVQLPFLQSVLPQFRLVPLLVGNAATIEVAEMLDAAWGGPETLILVSSDLSHYLDYESSREWDRRTSDMIEQLDWQKLRPEQACGCRAICGLLHVAQQRGLRAQTIDLRNSGDTVGSRDSVVGYGAYLFQ